MIEFGHTRHAEDTSECRPGEFVWIFDGLEDCLEMGDILNDIVLVLLIEGLLIELSQTIA